MNSGKASNSATRVGRRRRLHRIAEVRKREGLSVAAAARRLESETAKIRAEELPTSDMTLSRLYEWQDILGVPIVELLVEEKDALAPPIHYRSMLVRVMKTVLALREMVDENEYCQPKRVRRFVDTMVEQLVELMPELEEVGPWHSVGRRRRRDELGAIAQHSLAHGRFCEIHD